jgi:hypothetical protein
MTQESRVPPQPKRGRDKAGGPAPTTPETGAAPLPQREPGKKYWPTPITRATPPRQLESLLRRLQATDDA